MARVKPGHCTMACCMALLIIAFSDTEKAPLAAEPLLIVKYIYFALSGLLSRLEKKNDEFVCRC